MKLAQVTLDIAQTAKNKGVPGTANFDPANQAAGFGTLVGSLLSVSMVVAALLVFMYLIWGGFEWITSQGDKGKIEKARQRITGAVLGLVVLASVVALFIVIQEFVGIEVLNFVPVEPVGE